MIVTTTATIDGHPIQEYLGVAAGEAIMGANVLKDISSSIRDLVGGRSGSYEKVILQAREIAMQELIARATDLGANAIVGVDIDYETIDANAIVGVDIDYETIDRGADNSSSMLMVTVSGTAVRVAA